MNKIAKNRKSLEKDVRLAMKEAKQVQIKDVDSQNLVALLPVPIASDQSEFPLSVITPFSTAYNEWPLMQIYPKSEGYIVDGLFESRWDDSAKTMKFEGFFEHYVRVFSPNDLIIPVYKRRG